MRTEAKISYATTAVSLAGASTSVLILLYASRPLNADVESIVWFLAVGAWTASPHLPLACVPLAFAFYQRHRFARDVVLCLGTAVVAVFGSWIYFDAFFVHLDAQNGVIFFFLPFWQWIGVAATLGIAFIAGVMSRRAGQSPG